MAGYKTDTEILNEKVKHLYGAGVIEKDSDIANTLGVHRSNISNYLSGRVKPSKHFMEAFNENYGKYFANKSENKSANKLYKVNDLPPSQVNEADPVNFNQIRVMYVPLINKYAYAGYLKGFGDDEYIEKMPTYPFLIDKEYKGDYVSIEVAGESMDDGSRDGYREGDVLLCREVPQHHWQNKLHIKKWDFVIVTKTDGILIKTITKHDTQTGDLILHSRNTDYKDLAINLNDVAKLFNVVQVSIKK